MVDFLVYNWYNNILRSGSSKSKKELKVACVECKFHSAAAAGSMWDRCKNPLAMPWEPVRGYDDNPQCYIVRSPTGNCGPTAKLMERKDQ